MASVPKAGTGGKRVARMAAIRNGLCTLRASKKLRFFWADGASGEAGFGYDGNPRPNGEGGFGRAKASILLRLASERSSTGALMRPPKGAGHINNEPRAPTLTLEPASAPHHNHSRARLPDPILCDASAGSLRQRTVNFAAMRMSTCCISRRFEPLAADHHLRWCPAAAPGNLASRPAAYDSAPSRRRHHDRDRR
jgi:hypothetical protein